MPRVRPAVRPHAAPSTSVWNGPAPPKHSHPPRPASASAAVPPTPPRTTHKRKRRSRSRASDSSSDGGGTVHDSSDEASDKEDEHKDHAGAVVVGHKKRKTLSSSDAVASSEALEEDQFWMGDAASTELCRATRKSRACTRSRTLSPPSSPPAQRLRPSNTGLLSPPPSRRAPVLVPRPATPPPSTCSGKARLPERDSPNNPFLDDSSSSPDVAHCSSAAPNTRTYVEQPTITMVFRGVRTEVPNPHYVPDEVAAENDARARLPVRHIDYSPSSACRPTLLFPEARTRKPRNARPPPVPVPTSPTPAARSRAGSRTSRMPGDEAESTLVANLGRRMLPLASAGSDCAVASTTRSSAPR
ncbi:hypothetical protein C8Q76DRAFT_790899 [Earliella scabrosa]|nr:hypothetical protein C8Q76DRAFT_790899 [Earliella scabrosa]